MAQGPAYSGRLRKRAKTADSGAQEALDKLLRVAEERHRFVVFTGSGLSATSGMSMFSTNGGLYERARKRFKLQDGSKLFSYPFYQQRPLDVQSFLTQIYLEAKASQPTPGHLALGTLQQLGILARHYTLNIDGLAEALGLATWHEQANPSGTTVEMHGNIKQAVCPACCAVQPMDAAVVAAMKARKAVDCPACLGGQLRSKVMLYDDKQGFCITPETVWKLLEADLQTADMVLWVGISFEQSASIEYFRKVRRMLQAAGRLSAVAQAVINPCEEAMFNLTSAFQNPDDVQALEVRVSSDQALPQLAEHLVARRCGRQVPSHVSQVPAQASQPCAALKPDSREGTSTAGDQVAPMKGTAGEAGQAVVDARLEAAGSCPPGPEEVKSEVAVAAEVPVRGQVAVAQVKGEMAVAAAGVSVPGRVAVARVVAEEAEPGLQGRGAAAEDSSGAA